MWFIGKSILAYLIKENIKDKEKEKLITKRQALIKLEIINLNKTTKGMSIVFLISFFVYLFVPFYILMPFKNFDFNDINYMPGLACFFVLAFCLFLTGCKKTECEKNGHNFNEATCEKAATYYYSCVCGAKGTETFESGEKLEHTLEEVEVLKNAIIKITEKMRRFKR